MKNFLCCFISFLFMSCGQPAEQKTILKLNHVQSSSDPVQVFFVKLAEKVAQDSKGSLVIEVYANSELGSNKDNIEQITRGANIIAVGDAGFLADYIPDYAIMNGPFLYNNYQELEKLEDSSWHKALSDRLSKDKNIKVLSLSWYFGSRHLISGKEVKTPSDLKGMKVRIPSNVMWKETISAMGGNPTPLQWSEVYSGLSQGVIDAAEAPLSVIYTSKLHEAKKKIALTGHFYGVIGLHMSQAVFDKLTDEQKTILTNAVREIGREYSIETSNTEENWRKKLESEGVVFNNVNTELFRTATEKVYQAFPTWSTNLYDQVKAALK